MNKKTPNKVRVRTLTEVLEDRIEELENRCEHLETDRNNLKETCEKFREERDDARRRVCEYSLDLGEIYRRVDGKTVRVTTPTEVADMMNWDCYKEDKEAFEYFSNLTSDPQDSIISLEDMEKTIKFHEAELQEEDKRVEGTDEYPNYGDDFADMVHIARRLFDMVKAVEQERNEAWSLRGRIFNEIDCRIEHGAESNGHLEAIRNLFTDKA